MKFTKNGKYFIFFVKTMNNTQNSNYFNKPNLNWYCITGASECNRHLFSIFFKENFEAIGLYILHYCNTDVLHVCTKMRWHCYFQCSVMKAEELKFLYFDI